MDGIGTGESCRWLVDGGAGLAEGEVDGRGRRVGGVARRVAGGTGGGGRQQRARSHAGMGAQPVAR